MLAWLFVLLQHELTIAKGVILVVCALLTVLILAAICVVWTWWQAKDEEARSAALEKSGPG